MHTSFYNKNEFRKYPLRGTSNYMTVQGIQVPLALFCGLSLTTTLNHSDLFISRLWLSDSWISVSIKDYTNNITLGTFSGALTSDDYTQIQFTSYDGQQSGFLTIGKLGVDNTIKGSFEFDYINGKIEDSTILVYQVPAVSGLNHSGNILTGKPALVTDNINVTTASPVISLTTSNLSLIEAKGVYSSTFGNCNPKPIFKINTVEPNASGNIDIYGVDPVSVAVGTALVALGTGTFDLVDLCKANQKNIPPTNTADNYPTYGSGSTEEWRSWPHILGL